MQPELPSPLPEGSTRRAAREQAAAAARAENDAREGHAAREGDTAPEVDAARARDAAPEGDAARARDAAPEGSVPAGSVLERDAAPAAPGERKRRVWPWVLLGVLVVLVVGGAIAVVLGLQFLREVDVARDSLEKAKAGISTLSAQLTADEPDRAAIQATADDITAKVAAAADTVDGPLWNLAAQVPFVGQNVDAVQRVTRAVDVLVDQALPLGLDILSTTDLTNLTIEGGGIDLEPFRQVQDDLPQLAEAFAAAQEQIAPIDTATLMPEVSEPIAEILDLIDTAAPALGVAEEYLPTLLDVAGSGGTKTYLLVFQNNAEIRATGGNPAATMVVTMTDGRLGYVEQAAPATFEEAGTDGIQYLSLPSETADLYLPGLTRYSQDFTMTPDFPTTAALFEALWSGTTGVQFDGVISIDPVVLADLLAVAGPVTLATGEQLTADNAVQVLLSDTYQRFPLDGAASDAFFADTAQRVFAHLVSSSWDPLAMLEALRTAADEQRVYLSFDAPAAQAFATELAVDGALQTDNAAQTQLGIYLNDASVSKLEYHLTSTVAASCDAAARTITVTTTLHNGVPDGVGGYYTLGLRNAQYGIPDDTMMLDAVFFAPPGATILSTQPAVGDVSEWERSGTEKGNTAVSKTVFVPRGETVTVSYTVALPDGELGPLNLRHSPTATSTPVTIEASCDALFPESAATPAAQG